MNTKTGTPVETGKYPQQLKHPNVQLWRQIKAAAALTGQSMTEWVEETSAKRLAEEAQSKEKGEGN
jgi:hypothetical protein